MRLLAASAALLCFGVCGCGAGGYTGGCTADVRPAIVVSVTDAATGANIAGGSTVVVTDGSYMETLRVYGFSVGLDGSETTVSFGGAYERAGTYTVLVTRAGYAPATQSRVKAAKGDCHVDGQTVTVALTPQAQ